MWTIEAYKGHGKKKLLRNSKIKDLHMSKVVRDKKIDLKLLREFTYTTSK